MQTINKMTTIIRYIETSDRARYYDTKFSLDVDHALVKSQIGRLSRKRENQLWTFAATKEELITVENLEPKVITIDGNDIIFDSNSDKSELFEVHPSPWVNLKIGKNFNGRPKLLEPRSVRCTIHPSIDMTNYLSNVLKGKLSGRGLYKLIRLGIENRAAISIPDELRGKKAHDYSVRLTQAEYAALDTFRLPNESNLQLTLRLIYTGSKYF